MYQFIKAYAAPRTKRGRKQMNKTGLQVRATSTDEQEAVPLESLHNRTADWQSRRRALPLQDAKVLYVVDRLENGLTQGDLSSAAAFDPDQ